MSSTWHLKINEKNLGWRKNFFHLLNLASQDIIFTCDQDDIWHETKIEEMSSLFRNKKIQVLVTDYHELVELGGLCEELKKLIQKKMSNK